MDLRPLRQHRPHHAGAGGRADRTRRFAALALLLALCTLVPLAAACGDDDSAAATPLPTAGPAPKAADLLPQIGDLGYVLDQQTKDPTAPAVIDTALALYRAQAYPGRNVQVRVYVFPDAKGAKQQYDTAAEAFRNPPPEVFGTAVHNLDYGTVAVGDQQKAYITQAKDAQGNFAWTDILRKGRVVVVMQVLAPSADVAKPVRQAIAERTLAHAS